MIIFISLSLALMQTNVQVFSGQSVLATGLVAQGLLLLLLGLSPTYATLLFVLPLVG